MILRPVFPPWSSTTEASSPSPPASSVNVTHEIDLDLCLHCTQHESPTPRNARKRGGWCRKCREYHRDPRKRNRDGTLRCPVCTTVT